MTATFWTGSSLSFTNGSKTVTVNTGPSLDSVKANSSLTAGNYNEPVEVKSVSGNTITLYKNWPGSTGTTSATIKPSAAAAASAGVAAQQLITEIQNLVGNASATATANSFVKRDSNGRIKAALPSANDDVVTKGYLGSAATRSVGTSAANLVEVGSSGVGVNLSIANAPTINNADTQPITGLFRSVGGEVGLPISSGIASVINLDRSSGESKNQIYIRADEGSNSGQILFRGGSPSSSFTDWLEIWHSGNTNFNEFGGNGSGDGIAVGYMATGGTARFFVPINSKTPPSSITTSGSFSVREINTVINTNITSVTLSGGSSNKIGLLEVTGLTGTAGNPVVLQIENASSSIAFNF
ncbi:hypothetical protein ACM257_17795 [Alteromonas macleodii]|uniref:hypothetical protein n=1 Tax=Alteromonas macleodii TaxID=28108 RepID=UPI0039F6C158